jgi:hypothetical protein
MNHDLEAKLVRLATQPLPLRLHGLEAHVLRSLESPRRATARTSWRYAAVGLALVTGMGVGATAPTLRHAPLLAADLSAGSRLAPSSLL